MILLSGFLDTLFRALIFVGQALCVGGAVFYYAVLRPLSIRGPANDASSRRVALLISIGAFTVAVSQFIIVLVAASALANESGQWPIQALLTTSFARSGMIRIALALCLGFVAVRLVRRPISPIVWGSVTLIAILTLISGAWLTHGASRLNNAAMLMSVTVIHQFAAAVWIGGVINLANQWYRLGSFPERRDLWPRMVSRFSPIALASVGILVTAGIYLSWEYIHTFRGLLGTAYGVMLLSKIALLAVLLFLGRVNFLTIRHAKLTGDRLQIFRRMPTLVEIEAGVGTIILLMSSALTAQPPAVDIISQQATPREVIRTFEPKIPQLIPPPHAKMVAQSVSSLDIYRLPTRMDRIQSDFNHNISGIFVILIGLGAFLNRITRARWTKYWPLLFLPFAVFLLIFGEPDGWPFGNQGFFTSLIAPDVLTHRLATLLVVVLGVFLWRIQVGTLGESRWRYLFPGLCVIGGALLLIHSHSIFPTKWAFLIEVSHNAIGVLAVMAGAAGWVEMRMQGRESRIAGILWPIFFTLIGLILLFYREI